MLNVSRAIDTRFLQPLTLIQRVELVDNFGQTQSVPTSSAIYGVVTQPSKPGRTSMADALTYADSILVTTKSVLNSNSVLLTPPLLGVNFILAQSVLGVGGNISRMADLIVYRGRNYIVAMVYDYEFNGYTRALCKLIDLEGGINA